MSDATLGLKTFTIVTLSILSGSTIRLKRKFLVLKSEVASDQFKPGSSIVYFLSKLERRKPWSGTRWKVGDKIASCCHVLAVEFL